MSSRRIRFTLPAILVLSLVGASLAVAASRDHKKPEQSQFAATLIGHNETPAIHTGAHGNLSLTINADNSMSFVLTYSGLTAAATAAHVHFGQPNVAGGVSFFLCGVKSACPAGTSSTATVTGTVLPADVLVIATQGMAAGDIGAIVGEIRDGFAYANIHTSTYPGGEIRGQLVNQHGHGHDNSDD